MKAKKSKLGRFTWSAAVLGLLVCIVLLQLSQLRTAAATHKLLMIQTQMMLGSAMPEPGPAPQDSSLLARR